MAEPRIVPAWCAGRPVGVPVKPSPPDHRRVAEPRIVPAWCAGRPVGVPVKPSPPDHRRVACPSCGAQSGNECREIGTGSVDFSGHASRRRQAQLRYGA